jgi:hypothetical protein
MSMMKTRESHTTVRKLTVVKPVIQALLHSSNLRKEVDSSVGPNRRKYARFVRNLVTLSNVEDLVVVLFIWNVCPSLWEPRRM